MIESDYTGELRVLLRNNIKRNYQIRKGDRIAQIIVTQIDDSELMEVDELRGTERANKGFGSTDSIPTRALETTEVDPTISFLQADASNNEYFDTSDEAHHARLKDGIVLMSNAIIRSEERRVGKECKARWTTEHYK